MRNLFTVCLAVLFLALPFSAKAEDYSVAAPIAVGAASIEAIVEAGSIGASWATMAIGSTGLIYVINSGFDPWTPLFPSVEYSYPVRRS